ncbi:unnamed protein product, partial [Didymodactylos carnosus]
SCVIALYSRGPWLCIQTANGDTGYIPRIICSLHPNRSKNAYMSNNSNSSNHYSLSSTSSGTSSLSSRGQMNLVNDRSSDNDVLDLTTVLPDQPEQYQQQQPTHYWTATSLSSIYGNLQPKPSHRQKITAISKRQLLNENRPDMMIGNCDINRYISRSSSLINKSHPPKPIVVSTGETFINQKLRDMPNNERHINTRILASNKQSNSRRSTIGSSLFSLNCATVPVTKRPQQQLPDENYNKRYEPVEIHEIDNRKSNLELSNRQQQQSPQLFVQPRDTDSSSTQDSGFSEPYFLVDGTNYQQFRQKNLLNSLPQSINNDNVLQQQEQNTVSYDILSRNSKSISSLKVPSSNTVPSTFPSNKVDNNNGYRLGRSKRHTLIDGVHLNNYSHNDSVVNKRHSFGAFQPEDDATISFNGDNEHHQIRVPSVDCMLKPHTSEMAYIRTVNDKYPQVTLRSKPRSNQQRLLVKKDVSTLTQSLNRLEDMNKNYEHNEEELLNRNNRSNLCLAMPKSHDQIPTRIILTHHRHQATIEKMITASKQRQSKPNTSLSSSYQFGSSHSAFRPVKPNHNIRASSEGHSPVDHQLSFSSSLSTSSSISTSSTSLKNTDDALTVIKKKPHLILKCDPKRRLSCDVSLNNTNNNNLNISLMDNISLTQSTYDNVAVDRNTKSSSTMIGPSPFIRTMSDICDKFSELNIDEIEKDSLNPIPTYRTKKLEQNQLLLKMMVMNKNKIGQGKTSLIPQNNDLIKILKDYRNPRSSFSVKRGDYVCLLKQVGKACFLVRKHNGQIGFLPKALMGIETKTIDAFLQMHGYRETVI